MPYASIIDVNSLLSFVPTFTATSKPNATQVHHFLAWSAAELDSELALADYTIPVATSATHSLELLKGWNAVGAAWYTSIAMAQGKDSLHERAYKEKWQAILKLVGSDETILSDAGRDAASSDARHGGSATPIFKYDPLDY